MILAFSDIDVCGVLCVITTPQHRVRNRFFCSDKPVMLQRRRRAYDINGIVAVAFLYSFDPAAITET